MSPLNILSLPTLLLTPSRYLPLPGPSTHLLSYAMFLLHPLLVNGWYILVTPLPGNFITENILEKEGIWTGLLAINVGITYVVSVGVHATVERPFHEVGVFVIRRMVGDGGGGTEMENYFEEGEVLLDDKEDRIGHAEL